MNEKDKDRHLREINSSMNILKENDLISIHAYNIYTVINGKYKTHKVNFMELEGSLTYIDSSGNIQTMSFILIESIRKGS